VIYLLDAHTFLWWSRNHPDLSKTARDLITNPESVLALSIASAWELSLKCSLGKLPDYEPLMQSAVLLRFLDERAVQLLPITPEDISVSVNLPKHHKDPFDRLIIAQAQRFEMTIVTKDDAFKAYDVAIVW
jgi:PIN domain nuclease of toxin-antitoxin system